MSHYRSRYREVVRRALQADPALAGFREISAWVQNIDPRQLPAFGVATPSETSSRQGGDTVHRVTTLQLAARVLQPDGCLPEQFEAELDGLSLAMEAVVLGALDAEVHILELTHTATSIDATGERRIGTVLMSFSLTRFTDAGSAI